MASLLGKRKRRDVSSKIVAAKETAVPDDDVDVQEAFRRAFEAKFKPLKGDRSKTVAPAPAQVLSADSSDEHEQDAGMNVSDESDWTGFSESEQEDTRDGIEVVEHGRTASRDLLDRKEVKAFMSSKPPTRDTTQPAILPKRKGKADAADDDTTGTEADNLKNDLALQRLLSESHLLESNAASGTTELVGRNRVKALDLRIQALGGKRGAVTQQQKMAMALRKGIDGKSRERDGKRRQDARENGIILERATGMKGATDKGGTARPTTARKRITDVVGPSVGRFKGGALMLNEREIRAVSSRGGKGQRGRGGSRGSRGGGGRGRGGKR